MPRTLHHIVQDGGVVGSKSRHLKKRGGVWHYYRRTPEIFRKIDPRPYVEISLHTGDLAIAEKAKPAIERAVEDRWVALLKGESDDADKRYESAVELARLMKFEYRPAGEIAGGQLADLIRRVERLEKVGVLDHAAGVALLGGRDVPTMNVSAAWAKYQDLTRDLQHRYSPDQLRRWKAPRAKAVENFIAAIGGDRPLGELTRADALQFRSWWLDRVTAGKVGAGSANKDIGHIAQILRTVGEALELGVPAIFARVRVADEESDRGQPIATDWIRDRLLAPGALDGLNDEARDIILVMVETGMRPSEICGLLAEDIHLDAPVPHVEVVAGPGRRRLKTPYSARPMPLIGVALEAMRRHPDGFPRYHAAPAQLSGLVNKVLRGRGLLPSADHSLYSLRHSFADRLHAADAPDRVHADLMGHKFERPRYGQGPTLEHKREWLMKIAVSVGRGAANGVRTAATE